MKMLMIMATLPITIVTARPDQIEENTNPNVQYITPTGIENNQPMYNELIPIESRSKRSTSEVEDTGDIFCLKNEDMFCNPSNVEWKDEQCTVHRSYYKDLSKRTPEEIKWAQGVEAEIQKIKNNETKPWAVYRESFLINMPDPMHNPKGWSLQKPIGTQYECQIQCLHNKTRVLSCYEKIKCDQPSIDSFTSKIFFYCETDGCYNYSSGFLFGFSLMLNMWLWPSLVKDILKKRKLDKKNLKRKDSESGSCVKVYLE